MGGLATAVNLERENLNWQSSTRILYHVCDEPPHGTKFHNFYDKIAEKERELLKYIKSKRGVCRKVFGEESAVYNWIFQCKWEKERRVRLKQFIQEMYDTYDLYPKGYTKHKIEFEWIFNKMKAMEIEYYISKNCYLIIYF